MKINVEGLAKKDQYDKRNFIKCNCGKHFYPSKKMFVEFLKQFKSTKANVDIWSIEKWDKDEVTISLELTYKVGNKK